MTCDFQPCTRDNGWHDGAKTTNPIVHRQTGRGLLNERKARRPSAEPAIGEHVAMKVPFRTSVRRSLLVFGAALSSASSQEASSFPSSVPSDVPSSVPAPSAVPTVAGGGVPSMPSPVAAPKTCAFGFNTERCASLMKSIPSTER